MQPKKTEHHIRVGSHLIALPPGVTAADWGYEKLNQQNPRIRSFLGCIRLLEGVLESNYAILHCSPERLLDIWGKVREVSRLLREEIGPLLGKPSRIPSLEQARRGAEVSLAILRDQVLAPLDRLPERVPAAKMLELRKLLCVSIGQLHVFLQETFGELMAADPRSVHDADYFLSRRFPRDIEEAEWLLATVSRLDAYLRRLFAAHTVRLRDLAAAMARSNRLPAPEDWRPAAAFLDALRTELTPRLHEVLALRGIRFDELETLDRYAAEIPADSLQAEELHAAAWGLLGDLEAAAGSAVEARRQMERDRECCHARFSRRITAKLTDLDRRLEDLEAFLPLWLDNIGRRRALLFRRPEEASA
jgi:hypothetical protein